MNSTQLNSQPPSAPMQASVSTAAPLHPAGDCILFATADWDTPYWTNKQHTADHLAKAGWRVLYVESIGLRAPRIGSGTDWGRLLRRLWRGIQGPRMVRNRIWVYSPLVLPFLHHHPWVRGFNQGFLAWNVKRFLKRHNFESPLVWTYHPYVLELLSNLRRTQLMGPLVYHCVDDLSSIPGIDAQAFNVEERRLLAVAGTVFTTSAALQAKCAAHNAHVYDFPNVVDLDHFLQATSAGALPGDIKSIPEPRIGYIGALSDFKVDFPLLLGLAKARPEWHLILIGEEREGQHDSTLEEMSHLPNVHLLGHKSYAQLPEYLRGIRVGLLPTKLNDYTRSMFPMKYFEYIAAGLPVVSTPLEFTKTEGPSPRLRVAGDASAFELAVADLLDAPRLDQTTIRQMVNHNTWSSRLEKMLGLALRKSSFTNSTPPL